MDFVRNVLKGILIGIGAIAPGVSGGAIAMVLGLYEKIVGIISTFFRGFFRNFKQNIIFLLPLGIGVGIGVVLFSNVLKFLFANFKVQTSYAFAGLIAGTLPVLFRRANRKGFKPLYLLPMLLACAAAVSFVYIEASFTRTAGAGGMDIALNVSNIAMLAMIGFIIAGSLVIPGISGSVLMILLGVYTMLLDAVSTINIPLLVPMGAGLGAGVLFFSKIMDILLKKAYSVTYYAVIGFLIGSIPEVLSVLPKGMEGVAGVILFIAGAAGSYFFSRLEKES